jgi:hypothetical protein
MLTIKMMKRKILFQKMKKMHKKVGNQNLTIILKEEMKKKTMINQIQTIIMIKM